jgi:hypothetical protein
MRNDMRDVDIDAPIPFSLTEYGLLTVAAWRAELRDNPTVNCSDCKIIHSRQSRDCVRNNWKED